MAYITGTITSANPGADLYAAMAPALTTAGFTLVDTVVISTRTHKIWKCAAANNSAGLDWYADIAYFTTGAGNLSVMPIEYFDPATDLAYRMVYAGAISTTIETTYYSRWGATGQTLESANYPLNASVVNSGAQVTTSTSAFGYWISITGDRILVLSSINPGVVIYSGLYTPYPEYATKAGAALYPLILAGLSAGGIAAPTTTATTTKCGLTRMPQAATINWGGIPNAGPILPSPVSTAPGGPFYFSAGAQLIPIVVQGEITAGVAYTGLLGTIKDVATTVSSGIVRGDTFTVGSDTWICGTTVSNYSIAFKAA